MPRAAKSCSGRLTLRIKPEIHKELVELSRHFGVDLTTIINIAIRDVLPRLRKLADNGTSIIGPME